MRLFRPVALVVLLGVLGAPATFAATHPAARPETPRAAERGVLLQVRTFLVNLWSATGCRMDPWGRCLPGATAVVPTGDSGCRADPWGNCGAAVAAPTYPTADTGCGMDPWGGCISGH